MNLKSKFFGLMLMAAFAVLAMPAPASAQHTMGGMSNSMADKNIVEVAMSDSRFSMLVDLVKAAGLADTLMAAGPYTVFAPTNDAFAKVPAKKLEMLRNNPEMLKQVLLYHVLGMKVAASDAKTMPAPTAQGSNVKVKVKMNKGMAPSVMVDNAKVIQADIMASNGVIHVIDTVLMPKMNNMMGRKMSR